MDSEKKMIITIVAFNVKEVNSTMYRKFKTVNGAVKAFEKLLEDDNTDFISIRKSK